MHALNCFLLLNIKILLTKNEKKTMNVITIILKFYGYILYHLI